MFGSLSARLTFPTMQEVSRPSLQDEIRARYAWDIEALEALGFQEGFYVGETSHPLAAVLRFPVLIAMRLKREVVKLHGPLRYTTYHPVLIDEEVPTYAFVFAMGVKLYTRFVDGSVIISVNFASAAGVKPASNMEKYAAPLAIDENWILHRYRVERCQEEGRIIDDRLSMEDFFQLEREELEHTVHVSRAPNCSTGMRQPF